MTSGVPRASVHQAINDSLFRHGEKMYFEEHWLFNVGNGQAREKMNENSYLR